MSVRNAGWSRASDTECAEGDQWLASISHTHGVGGGRVLRRLPHTGEAGSVPVAWLSRAAPQCVPARRSSGELRYIRGLPAECEKCGLVPD